MYLCVTQYWYCRRWAGIPHHGHFTACSWKVSPLSHLVGSEPQQYPRRNTPLHCAHPALKNDIYQIPVYIYMHKYEHMYQFNYAHQMVNICMYVPSINANINIHIHIHMWIYIYVYVYTYIHIHVLFQHITSNILHHI